MKEFSEKEFLLLAYLEGDLDEVKKAKVEAMLAEDAALMSEYRLLTKTILPVEAVEYSQKSALKKDVAPQRVSLAYMVWTGAVAAVLAILLVMYSPSIQKSNNVAKNEKAIPAVKDNTDENVSASKESEREVVASLSTDVAPTKKQNKTNLKVAESTIAHKQKKHSTVVIEAYDKKQLVTSVLSQQPSNIPTVNMPSVNVDLQRDFKLLIPTIELEEEPKGWLARKSQKINNTLNTWVSYLQKPNVEISKNEPLGGRTYWALTVTADKYEWEGKLYTRRQ